MLAKGETEILKSTFFASTFKGEREGRHTGENKYSPNKKAFDTH